MATVLIRDIPEAVETVIIEVPDPNGPWGARGLGELPFLVVAPAIAAGLNCPLRRVWR